MCVCIRIHARMFTLLYILDHICLFGQSGNEYECEECEYKTSWLYAFQRHRRTHTPTKMAVTHSCPQVIFFCFWSFLSIDYISGSHVHSYSFMSFEIPAVTDFVFILVIVYCTQINKSSLEIKYLHVINSWLTFSRALNIKDKLIDIGITLLYTN